jgi:hypothetical protein
MFVAAITVLVEAGAKPPLIYATGAAGIALLIAKARKS